MFEFMFHLKSLSTLNIAALAGSEDYPNPYAIYSAGFQPCNDAVLLAAENDLGYGLPLQLRAYYSEIGVGSLVSNESQATFSENNVLIPTHIAKLVDGTCGWMLPYTQIEPDTLPFFERALDTFICLKPKSDNPNAVWWMWGELMPDSGKICDSLVEFFQRLVADPNWFNPTQNIR
jgi:hypothetical protein